METINVVSWPLKDAISLNPLGRRTPRTKPATVTDKIPVSCWTQLETANTTRTIVKTVRFLISSGIRSFIFNKRSKVKAAIPPKTNPMERLVKNALITESYPDPLVFKNVNNTTAKSAPMGSIKIPSHLNTVATLLMGLTTFNNGMMTVGPETVINAPNKRDIFNPLVL